MIFVDHVYGDPVGKITYRAFGFSDAAEIFVFLSGLVCGIAYSRVLVREGLRALIWVLAKRAARIYFYYALSSGAVIALVSGAVTYLALDEQFGVSVAQPLYAMLSALYLISPPSIAGILVLYIALTLVVTPVLLIAGDRHWPLALGVSGLTWAGAQISADFLAPLTHRWYLNPFAWQFLFAIGLMVGRRWDSKQPILPVFSQRRWLMVAAWTIVVGGVLHKILISRSGFDITWLRLEPSTLLAMKENLSPIRLLHFLSVALLVSVYFRHDNLLLRWRISMPVTKVGTHSLEIFSLSVVLDYVVNIMVLTGSPSFLDRLLLDGMVFLLLALTAAAYQRAIGLAASDRLRMGV